MPEPEVRQEEDPGPATRGAEDSAELSSLDEEVRRDGVNGGGGGGGGLGIMGGGDGGSCFTTTPPRSD